jgi:pimeloyl-ACP methyl ester carboxylesterase
MTTWSLPGLELFDLTLPVPLDHADPAGPRIELFARLVTAPGGEELPILVYLQGGPGSEAPRPVDATSPPWLPRALREHRVLLLDQRGTGRSTPVGPDAPLPEGAIPGARSLREASPAQQAHYLTHFRADAIVADAELLRLHLGIERWSLLGQSFGGFTTLRYLSAAAHGVEKALFTGGLPTVGPGLDEVYRTTWQGMIERSEQYWARFPGDRDRFRRLADAAAAGALRVPGGRRVCVEALRRLGHLLGASQGAERLHLLLELDPSSPAFAHDLAAALPFSGRNPLYAVIHESCWADGVATRWAAERTMPEAMREDPTLLAGEHVHRDLFAEDPELAPWAEAADILAEHRWPRLYDEQALRGAEVPGAAAVYYDDAYVPREHSMATAALLPHLRTWVTSEYEHNGLRASGEAVLDHLLDLAAGRRAA